MNAFRRSTVTLLMAAAVPLGGVALAPAASAHPAVAAARCGYPPGHCTISFRPPRVHRGRLLTAHVPKNAFRPDSSVSIVISHRHYHHRFFGRHANANGGFTGSVRIPKGAPSGLYTMRLGGHKAGHAVSVSGSFHVA